MLLTCLVRWMLKTAGLMADDRPVRLDSAGLCLPSCVSLASHVSLLIAWKIVLFARSNFKQNVWYLYLMLEQQSHDKVSEKK